MSTQFHGGNFLKRVKLLREKKKELDDEISRECERLMKKCNVPDIGSVVLDVDSGVRIKVTDRRMDPIPDTQNWSTYKFVAWLGGNPITKSGKMDPSTHTAIRHEFETY